MCEPLRSRSRRTVQQLCQLLHGPQIWKSVPASSVICALAGKLPGGPHGEVDPPCREPHDPPGRAVDGVAEPRAVDLPRLAEGLRVIAVLQRPPLGAGDLNPIGFQPPCKLPEAVGAAFEPPDLLRPLGDNRSDPCVLGLVGSPLLCHLALLATGLARVHL